MNKFSTIEFAYMLKFNEVIASHGLNPDEVDGHIEFRDDKAKVMITLNSAALSQHLGYAEPSERTGKIKNLMEGLRLTDATPTSVSGKGGMIFSLDSSYADIWKTMESAIKSKRQWVERSL